MNRLRYPLLILVLLLISATWLFSSSFWNKQKARTAATRPENHVLTNTSLTKLEDQAQAAKSFVREKGYNNKTAFFIDMSLPSGQNRFFVYDLKKDSIESSGLVTHGRCNEDWLEGRRYSNTVGAGCTSLGKYRIGHPYHGKFGLAYKLYGLEKSNDNAFKRYVVLHSHDCVPGTEVDSEICQSDGCPTVSPGFLQQLKSIIDGSSKPILLWIYQ